MMGDVGACKLYTFLHIGVIAGRTTARESEDRVALQDALARAGCAARDDEAEKRATG